MNENNHLESAESSPNKNIVALVIFAISLLLIAGIVLWVIFKKENKAPPKQEAKQAQEAAVAKKDFKESPVSGEIFLPREKAPLEAKPQNNLAVSQEKGFAKPLLVKSGASMVTTKAVEQEEKETRLREKYKSLEAQNSPQITPEVLLNLGQGAPTKKQDSQGEVFSPSIAEYSQFNPSLLLPKGTYIGCALRTRLVSEIKGGISCVVSDDVYSSNGHTLLIEKGSTITGGYSGGELNDGSTRLFVIWQEIRTPNNITIPVNSNATDQLGASGMEGYIDYHYLKRFGAAILLSVIDDAFSILANELSGRNLNYNLYNYTQNTREQASEIAKIALEKMIDIKPTLYKNQGDLVGVYVNRDVDFSKVYELRRKK